MSDFTQIVNQTCKYALDVSTLNNKIDMCKVTSTEFKSTISRKDGKFALTNQVDFAWPKGPAANNDFENNHTGYYATFMHHPTASNFFMALTIDRMGSGKLAQSEFDWIKCDTE